MRRVIERDAHAQRAQRVVWVGWRAGDAQAKSTGNAEHVTHRVGALGGDLRRPLLPVRAEQPCQEHGAKLELRTCGLNPRELLARKPCVWADGIEVELD